MIEDKLKQALEDESASRRRLLLVLVCVFVPLGLLLAGVIRFDFSLFGLSSTQPASERHVVPNQAAQAPVVPAPEASAPTPTAAPPEAVDLLAATDPGEMKGELGEGAQILADAPVPAAKRPEGNQGSEVDRAAAFRKALSAFERDIEPVISTEAFATWSREGQAEIMNAKSEALSLYAVGQYRSALDRLKEAGFRADHELTARTTAFQTTMDKAQAAYENGDHAVAEQHILEALRLDPASQAAKGLKTQVDLLPGLLSAVQKAEIARIENDPVEEAAHLKEAVTLAPERTDLKARLSEIEVAAKEQTFARHIQSGLDNVRAGRQSAARADLKAANALFGGRTEAKLLAAEIADLTNGREYAGLTEKAKRASEADDWALTESLLVQAQAIRPLDIGLKLLLQAAGEINELSKAVARYNRQPHRLAASNIETMARSDLERSKAYFAQSPSLARSTAALETNLKRYTTTVSIRVISDGATAVTVRGVARVGVVTEKRIALRPVRCPSKV